MTAKEYWKKFPKHSPPKDADITEAMEEYASLRVEEETARMKQALAFADEELCRLKTGKESQLVEINSRLTETNRQLVEALKLVTKKDELSGGYIAHFEGVNIVSQGSTINEAVSNLIQDIKIVLDSLSQLKDKP